ncbi:MAG TPA: cobalamin-binding protein, partial [Candidatus Binatia bacterium]|nr:cobalamin-binding protein [Candidatus Binatia bacterium]
FDVDRTLADVPRLRGEPGWAALPAVRAAEVWALDGSAYLSRPGPRIVDSVELLAEILHPDRFPPRFPATARRRLPAAELV